MLRKALFQLYILSSVFLVVAGILIGRIWMQIEHDHVASEDSADTHVVTRIATETEAHASFPPGVDLTLGASLFRNNCASCHNKNMRDDLTGPALANTQQNWADYPRTDLYAWIRNSAALAAQGHPRAQALLAEWAPARMTAFPNLTDAELESVLAYIEVQKRPRMVMQ